MPFGCVDWDSEGVDRETGCKGMACRQDEQG